ncbi:MAG: hypothetical protein ACYSTL_05145 [Planctomycetota bacterium]|jgi:predicted nucleic acid-binding Zn ribbon protein
MTNPFDSENLKDEGPLSIDLEELGDDAPSETVPCPLCSAEVYEDADRCNICGQYISPHLQNQPLQAIWWFLLMIVGIAAVIWVAIRLF